MIQTKIWITAKSFMNGKSAHTPTQIEVDGLLVSKAKLISVHMNTFFINKVNTVRKGMHAVSLDLS